MNYPWDAYTTGIGSAIGPLIEEGAKLTKRGHCADIIRKFSDCFDNASAGLLPAANVEVRA
jgi:hypothetical protein